MRSASSPEGLGPRSWVAVRGIYGGVPREVQERGLRLQDLGVNGVWVGAGALDRESIAWLRAQGARVFAEFNTLHAAEFLQEHPDAAPVGVDGAPCPPPDGWQGICPTHAAYRKWRMAEFRRVLAACDLDGIWLDYHHSHASWEQAVPALPDTCFCPRCVGLFQEQTGLRPEGGTPMARAGDLLGRLRESWTQWRCEVLTDWVREFRAILDATRPGALLGTFHCPWSESDFGGALRCKLAIDLHRQLPHLDVLSPMPYHARFGHAHDLGWISRQTADLGQRLGIAGASGERARIWPIVQASDWGEAVPVEQVALAVEHGSRPPATGVMAFSWMPLRSQWDKVEALGAAYRAMAA